MFQWLLEFDRASYGYPCSSRSAIQGLSLKVPTGKRCALIGQNGCGKTTFFLLANGLYQPQQGSIRWRGEPLRYDRSSLMQLRQQIGLVFQNPEHQVVASTVEEDISYGLHNLGLPEPEIAQRVQQAIAQFDLTELAHQPIHNLSLGQKKRVSIADVMVLQPTLLLLDEPTAYLDPRHTRNLIATLQQIQVTGTTILMATHDLDFVYRWADWVFVMNQGRLVLEGSPQDVFTQHQVLKNLELGLPVMLELLDKVCEVLNAEKSSSGNPSFTQHERLQQQVLQSFRW